MRSYVVKRILPDGMPEFEEVDFTGIEKEDLRYALNSLVDRLQYHSDCFSEFVDKQEQYMAEGHSVICEGYAGSLEVIASKFKDAIAELIKRIDDSGCKVLDEPTDAGRWGYDM